MFRDLFDGRSPSSDTTDRPANEHIGNNRQYCRGNQQFQNVNSTMNDELVDGVQNCGNDEYLPDILPALSQQLGSMMGIRENGPEEWRSPFTRILYSGPDRDDDGHSRLHDQPEVYGSVRTTDEVLPYTLEYLAHVLLKKPCRKALIPVCCSSFADVSVPAAYGSVDCQY